MAITPSYWRGGLPLALGRALQARRLPDRISLLWTGKREKATRPKRGVSSSYWQIRLFLGTFNPLPKALAGRTRSGASPVQGFRPVPSWLLGSLGTRDPAGREAGSVSLPSVAFLLPGCAPASIFKTSSCLFILRRFNKSSFLYSHLAV